MVNVVDVLEKANEFMLTFDEITFSLLNHVKELTEGEGYRVPAENLREILDFEKLPIFIITLIKMKCLITPQEYMTLYSYGPIPLKDFVVLLRLSLFSIHLIIRSEDENIFEGSSVSDYRTHHANSCLRFDDNCECDRLNVSLSPQLGYIISCQLKNEVEIIVHKGKVTQDMNDEFNSMCLDDWPQLVSGESMIRDHRSLSSVHSWVYGEVRKNYEYWLHKLA